MTEFYRIPAYNPYSEPLQLYINLSEVDTPLIRIDAFRA